MSKFFNFINKAESESAELYINGNIVSDDSVERHETFGVKCIAPTGFKSSLAECAGKPITVYIDSYGGDVLAASSIYTMLHEYKGQVTVKIDSIAASAASVIAMAGDKVLMSPTAYLMIHDPSTLVWGNITEVKQTLDCLKAIKDGIMNAYERKCGDKASREKISKLMTEETWLDYNAALAYGFIDGEIGGERAIVPQEVLDSIKQQRMVIYNLARPQNKPVEPQTTAVNEVVKQEEETAQARNDAKIRALELRKQIALTTKRF